MTTTVFTDPHLGRTMQAHTTAASRARLTDSIFLTTQLALTTRANAGPAVCLGDLFDKFQNPERTILDGVSVAKLCDLIMAGNHDVTNDRSKVGSLQLLSSLRHAATDCEIMIVPFGQAECYLKEVDGKDFIFIPHHTTDTLFQQSLKDAKDWAHQRQITRSVKPPAYLCLHCNYDSGFATDETALSLTRKEAKDLLDAGFDYILIGHDHHPREDFDGRVIILGNMHPTGFGDITHKRMLQINDDGSHTFVPVWSPEEKYLKLDVSELLSVPLVELIVGEGVPDFIEIEGSISPDRVLDLAKAIRTLWALEPMAIRNKVEIEKVGSAGSVNHDFASIDKVVLDDLADEPELRDLFLQYWNRTVVAVEGE